MRNKILFLVSVILLVALLMTASFAKDFLDVSTSHWAYETIIEMQKEGFIKGYPDGSFKPDGKVTREEFMQMLFNISTLNKELKTTNYIDVKSDRWSYEPIQAFGASIKENINNSIYFYPTKEIQRQEVAQVLSDYFNIEVQDDDYSSKKLEEEFNVNDAEEINSRYESAVYKMYDSGLMKGMEDNKFSPNSSLTRAQAATLLSRIIKRNSDILKPQEPEEPTSKVDLDLDFLKLENNKKNLIYSPLSIKYALKMLGEGAKENTKKEIDNLVAKYNLTKYTPSENLSLANSMFIRDIYQDEVLDSYIKTLKEKYNAEVIYDKFASADNINNWIEEKTFHLIKNVLTDDKVTPKDKVMFLINALAIDMKWDIMFQDENTRGETFYKADNSKINATTLKQTVTAYDEQKDTDAFNYYFDDDIQAIKKNLKEYDNTQLEFIAIMPKKTALNDFVKNTSLKELNEVIDKIGTQNISTDKNVTTRVNLLIPKFKYEYELKFLEDLKALGMKEAFDPDNANFFNMFKKPQNSMENYYVSEAIHKAMIEFSEEGIKAAAVTIFGMAKNTSIRIEEFEDIYIKFDHPFLYMIRDKKTGEIWFVGTMYEPNLWDNDKSEYMMKY